MRPLTDYRSALFDCDGVILASNGIKTDAFRAALADSPPDAVDAFIRYHQRNGGVSRHVKLRHFYEAMDPSADPAQRAAAAADRYGRLVRTQLERAPLIPGVLDVVEWFAARRVPCHVVSGGDEREVRDVLAARGLDRYFARISGGPRSKPDLLADLAAESRLLTPGVFFGDAEADLQAAERFGLDFCFVYGHSDWSAGRGVCRTAGHLCVRDFSEVSPA